MASVDPATEPAGAPRWRKVAGWAASGLLAAAALVALGLVLLDTGPGHRLVADRIAALSFPNGMRITVGRIEGSLYGRMRVHDLSLRDPRGEFLYAPEARLDWRPLGWLRSHLDIRAVTAARVMLRRVPRLREGRADQPLLPDLDIDVGRLHVDRFIAERPVSGMERVATISGSAHIARGRAKVRLEARMLPEKGGGDRLSLVLDAVPEANRLALSLDARAPRGGVLAALAGLSETLDMRLQGKGDWKAWAGTFIARHGASEVARLAITAREGTLGLRGPTRLGAVIARQPFARLLAPEARLDLTARLHRRAAQIKGTLAGEVLRLRAEGGIDLSDNSLHALRFDFALPRPAALARNLSATGLRGVLTLQGAFSNPRVDYDLSARQVVVGTLGVEEFAAAGKARVDADHVLIPVTASARRVTGLDGAVGGTIAHVRLQGDLAVKGARMLSDNLRIRSDRIDATALVTANLASGQYQAALKGRVDDYRIESVGILAVDSNLDLTSDRAGLGLRGQVRARSTQLLNHNLDQWLGGNFVAGADVRYGTDGIVRFDQVRLRAPELVITQGSATYAPDGRISAVASGMSSKYGTLGARVTGTLEQPDVKIAAARPGLGIGLAELEARIVRAAGGDYRLSLVGKTDYGPLNADVTVLAGGLEIHRADLSGVAFSGGLTSSAQGPYSGTLRAEGNGLSGVLRLSGAGAQQAIDFNLRASNSAFDGPARLTIGSAMITGRAILRDRPEVTADVQLGDTSYGGFAIQAARAHIDYRDGAGTARALIAGSNGAPFNIGANAVLEPSLWRVVVAGKARGIAFATSAPARIRRREGSYELLPSTIAVGGGTIRLAGMYGDRLEVQARMEDVDMAIANVLRPGLGLGGKASGSLDFAQAGAAAFPRVDARLKLAGFTLTSAATVSQPVDVNLSATLLPDGGEARAVFRQRGSVIGRLVTTLHPLPAASGSWGERLRGASLGGGIRYNGPAATLFSLTGLAGHSLDGPLGVAVDFSCQVSDPCLRGILRGKGLTYQNGRYGTRLTNLDVSGGFTGNRLQVDSFKAAAGSGTVAGSGTIGLSSQAGWPMDLSFVLDRARLARGDALSASATGQLRLTKAAGETALLSGRLELPETRYRIVREGAAQVPRLTGVAFKGAKRITGDEAGARLSSIFDVLRLDIALRAAEKLFVSGMGLESEWRANLSVAGTSAAPRLSGSLNAVRGTLGFAGRSFELSEGAIDFTGEPQVDPRLRIAANETVNDLAVTVNIGGRASNPQIAFNSIPSLPQDEVLSRILFGSSMANLSAIQAVQLAASLNSLRARIGGPNPLGKLRAAAGIDRLRILGADAATGRGTALAAGHYLTDDIYVELITDTRGFTATQIEVSVTPWLSVLSQAGGSGSTNAEVRFHKDY